MKRKIFLVLINITLSLSCFSQVIDWVKSEPYDSYVTWTNIVVHDKTGNTFTGSQYSNGVVIFKYDQNGNKLWGKNYIGYGSVTSLCTDSSGNLYAVILFGTINVNGNQYTKHGNTSNLFVKFDAAGNVIWVHETELFLKISNKTDIQGNIIGTGWFMDIVHLENNITLTSPPSISRLFIAHFNTNGECLWAIQDDGGMNPFICNAKGDMCVSSYLGGPITLGKGAKQITINSGTYMAKYASSGDLIWAKQRNSDSELGIDESGNIYSLEQDALRSNTADLVKYDPNGNILWRRTQLYTANAYSFAMKCGVNGDLFITGGFSGSMSIDSTTITDSHMRVYVAKIDSSGILKWITTTGGSGSAGAKDIAVANGNEIYITGDMGGVNTFGSNTVNQSSGVFVAKIIDNDVAATTIKDIPKSNTIFNVYPNPSGSVFNISYSTPELVLDLRLEIKNAAGQTIYNKQYKNFNNEMKDEIDLGKHAKGIYFLEIVADRKRIVKKIVLEY